jgi:hypothetical protein
MATLGEARAETYSTQNSLSDSHNILVREVCLGLAGPSSLNQAMSSIIAFVPESRTSHESTSAQTLSSISVLNCISKPVSRSESKSVSGSEYRSVSGSEYESVSESSARLAGEVDGWLWTAAMRQGRTLFTHSCCCSCRTGSGGPKPSLLTIMGCRFPRERYKRYNRYCESATGRSLEERRRLRRQKRY